MFNSKEIRQLNEEINRLRDATGYTFGLVDTDFNKLRCDLDLILDHLNLEVQHIPAKVEPEQYKLVQKPSKSRSHKSR